MRNLMKRSLTAVLFAAIVAVQPAMAEQEQFPADRRGGDMVVDALIVRPMGLVGLVLGAATFVVSLPFTIPSGSVDAARENLIMKPVRHTFQRPLGEVESE
jgi:hypothetical protein